MPSRATTVTERLLGAIIRELPFIGPDEGVCLGGVSFAQYRRLADAQERLGRRLQISYGAGRLEVLPNAFRTEVRKSVLRSIVWLAAEALGRAMNALGSTTVASEAGDYGFDPQESFALCPPGRVAIGSNDDAGGVPPPDLVIEVENPHRVGNRLPLFARAQVPEVWYDDLDRVQVLSFQPDGTYAAGESSSAFPLIRSQDLNRFLSVSHATSLTTISREFRAWIEAIEPAVVG